MTTANLLVLSKAQTETGSPAEGLGTLRRALTLYPIEPVYVNFIAAHVLWANGRHDEAIARATRCIERAPQFTNCRFARASALFESGRLDAARDEAQQILAAMPGATSQTFANLFAGVPALHERRLAIARGLGFPEVPRGAHAPRER